MSEEVTQPAISCTDISFSYGMEPVLQDITLDITAGDYVGMLGPNGAGKSTLIQIILGMLEPDTGNVRIFGEPVKQALRKQYVGYVPQRTVESAREFPTIVEEVIRSGVVEPWRPWKRLKSSEVQERVEEAIQVTDLGDLRTRTLSALSGGQLQRVFIARALAARPRILILDEPTTGVDARSQHEFFRFLKQMNKEHELTILIVSHDIDTITHETNTVVCLQCSLLCCMPRSEFMDSEHLKTMFGDGHATHVFHDHGVHELDSSETGTK